MTLSIVPIREINKSSARERKLRAALTSLLKTARFSGQNVLSMPSEASGVHADSICAVNLREALKARKVLERT